MTIWIMIFLLFASIFAIGVLVYVVVDFIVEKLRKDEEEPEEEPVEEEPEAQEEQPEVIVPPVVLADIVDHIDAEEADEMIPDDIAMAIATKEMGAGEGYMTYVNLGVVDQNFEAGETITLALLKEKNLVEKKAKRLKVLADGVLTKSFTVKAESYSIQAIKMIELTGGTVVILE